MAQEVKLGDLLNQVELKRRWIYQGSTSMPPCQTITYWNVLSTIYPISDLNYRKLKSQQLRNPKLNETGNIRNIQELGSHDQMYITDQLYKITIFDVVENYIYALVVAFLGLCCLYLYMRLIESNQTSSNSDDEDETNDD